MAFADPQSLTVDSTPVSMPRVGSSLGAGSFRSSDQKYQLDVRHQSGGQERHNVKLQFADVVGNPLVPTQNLVVGASVNLTVTHPKNGMTAESVKDLAAALAAWATEGNLVKLIGGEN